MTPPNADPADLSPRIRPAKMSEACRSHHVESTRPLIAEHDGRTVAGVNLTLTDDHTALIHGLWIDPSWAQTKLPLQMMVAVLVEGRRLGCLRVDMDPGVRGLAALALLLDRGLLMQRSIDASGEDSDVVARCYLNLYKNVASVTA